jgi:hypothetical protein
VGFHAAFPQTSVRSVGEDRGHVWGWAAHGWRGVWLVNGSSEGIVRVDLGRPGRGRVLGVPVRVAALRVAVEDPAGPVRALVGREVGE